MIYYITSEQNQNNYIAHHGVKGQRWGIRRYQNEDGTLTSAGQKRYTKELAAYEKRLDRYEKGRELYAKGETINKNEAKAKLSILGISALSGAAAAAIIAKGKDLVMKRGSKTITAPASTVGKKVGLTMLIGGGLAAALYYGRRQNQLRSYYAGKPEFKSKVFDEQ